MRKWFILSASLVTAAAFVSCATAKAPATPEPAPAPAVTEAPAPEPVMVEEPYWALNRVETAYPDGMLSGAETFDLDDTGRVLKDTTYDGKMTVVTVKSWTWSGDTASLEIADATGTVVGKGVQRWADGRLAEEIRLSPKGETQSTEKYEYDAEGQKTRWSVQTAQGNAISTEYAWESGRLASVSVKDAIGAEIKRFVRSYDAAGLPVAEEEYDAKGNLARKTTYVNEAGFIVGEEVRNGSGGMLSSIKYVNDEYGNPVEIHYLDRTGRLIETRKQGWTGYTRLVPQK